MYTTCPRCLSQFHVTVIHLTAANGKVRCSICNDVFNLIEHIHDQPCFAEQNEKSRGNGADIQQRIAAKPEAAPAKLKPAPETSDKAAKKILQQKQNRPQHKNDQGRLLHGAARVIDSFYQPTDLPTSSVFWSAGVFLLILVGLTQLSWFNRSYILQHYPKLNPYIEWFCARWACTSVRRGSIHSIKLINRDVRAHPGFTDTLLVNATMVNTASYIQPYPVIQLTLFDTDSAIIGSRRFSPRHYLDESIAIEKGMPTNEKIHFVLEIADKVGSAVSFEFRFLWQ